MSFDLNRAWADSAAVAPGSMNLITDDYTVGHADASVFGLSLGRTYRTRLPGESAAANSNYSTCGNKPQWDGLRCRSHAGGQPGSGPELPYTITTYDLYGQVREIVESNSSGELRRTTNTYDAAGRPYTVEVTTASGLGTTVPKTRTVCDGATGQPVAPQSLNLDELEKRGLGMGSCASVHCGLYLWRCLTAALSSL